MQSKITGYKDFIKTTWKQTWANQGLVIWTTIILMISVVIPVIPRFMISETAPDFDTRMIAAVSLATIVSVFLSFCVTFSLVEAVRTGKSLGESWKTVRRDFFSYLWPSVIISASLLSLVIIIGMALAGIYLMVGASIPVFIILTTIAAIGMIAISFYTTLYLIVRNAEGLRGIDALVRSVSLIKDYWWSVFGRVLVLVIISGLIAGAFVLVTSIALNLFGYDHILGDVNANIDPTPAGELFLSITSGLSQGIIVVLMFFGLFKIYEDLKAVKSSEIFVRAEHPRVRKFFVVTAWMAPVLFVIMIITGLSQMENIQNYFNTLETNDLENINREEMDINDLMQTLPAGFEAVDENGNPISLEELMSM